MHSHLFATTVALGLTTILIAQDPESVVTVAVSTNGTTAAHGEMYRINHATNKATRMTIPSTLLTDRPNCILMTSPVTGYLGTNPTVTSTPGNVYSFTLGGSGLNTLTLGNAGKPLNTTATAGGNIAQLAVIGTDLYFVSQTAGAVGTLQKVPIASGAVTKVYDVSKLPSTLLTNAMTAIGSKVYIGTWSLSSTAAGELIEVDVSKTVPTATKIMDFPSSKYKGAAGTSTVGFGCLNMHRTLAGNVACLGLYGDRAILNPATRKVVTHKLHAPKTNPVGRNNINSGFFDVSTNDWVIGTRTGTIERWVEDHHAPSIVTGVGTHPTATGNSVNGVAHWPNGNNSDQTYGAGCAISANGLTPTDVAAGAAVRGNSKFRLALYNAPASKPFFLGVGLRIPAINFGNPGCKLWVNPVLVVGATTPSSGPLILPAPLPNAAGVAARQWVTDDGAGGIVLSNARLTTIK